MFIPPSPSPSILLKTQNKQNKKKQKKQKLGAESEGRKSLRVGYRGCVSVGVSLQFLRFAVLFGFCVVWFGVWAGVCEVGCVWMGVGMGGWACLLYGDISKMVWEVELWGVRC